MSPARARLEGLSKDLKAFEEQIRDDMKEIRLSLKRIKWALRVAGGLSLVAIVIFAATVLGPLSHQLKQIAQKIEQLENQEVVAALTDVARLRAAIQSETQRIELDAHGHISEALERSRKLSTELQADLSRLSPDGNAFPDVYASAKDLAAALERAGEKVGPAAQFPPPAAEGFGRRSQARLGARERGRPPVTGPARFSPALRSSLAAAGSPRGGTEEAHRRRRRPARAALPGRVCGRGRGRRQARGRLSKGDGGGARQGGAGLPGPLPTVAGGPEEGQETPERSTLVARQVAASAPGGRRRVPSPINRRGRRRGSRAPSAVAPELDR